MGTMMLRQLLFFALSACLLLASMRIVGAFSPLQTAVLSGLRTSSTVVSGVVTGPRGKPASSHEEDLFLTLKVIMDHDARSTTVSKEQFIAQMQEVRKLPASLPPADVTVPYDAAAQLAYDKSDKSMPFREFAAKFEADAIQLVKAKTERSKTSAKSLSLGKAVTVATRRVWSILSRLTASAARIGTAVARRLYGACQKIVWKVKLRGG
jgi:hypothetical protein